MADRLTFDFTSSSKLITLLGEFPVLMETAVMTRVHEAALNTLDDAGAAAPVDTGDLQQSGHIRISKDKIEVVFGDGQSTPTIYSYSAPPVEADGYTWFQELGTTKMAAQPYLEPAFDENSIKLLEELSKLVFP